MCLSFHPGESIKGIRGLHNQGEQTAAHAESEGEMERWAENKVEIQGWRGVGSTNMAD